MSYTVLVVCRECAGTGNARGGVYQCGECLGQCHVAVDRAKDGGVPDGFREWRAPSLGDVPINPVVLARDAQAKA